MLCGEKLQSLDGGFGQETLSKVFEGEDYSDTHSSSSETSSDDGFSHETASSRSSVSSPGSSGCSEDLGSSYIPQLRSGLLPEWQGNSSECPSHKPVPPEQRQNPRRTSNAGENRAPPSLIRQSERKECFVACLVSFAAQFVEAIWPLAACTPRTDTSFHGRGVLSLRCFITETLRRSRTSYSTLQVALFYLVLIKDFVPRVNFTMEQPRGNEEFRAMQCGRRMFLTALILASKYLQDRNYSTRAWSKISGLRAQEIHLNEMEYCKKINWTLHVPKEIFDRWSYTVLRLSSPMKGPESDTVAQIIGWQKVLEKLNAHLTETFPTRQDFATCPPLSTLLPTNFVFGESSPENKATDAPGSTSTLTVSVKPVAPQPPQTCIISQPPQPRIGNLPTPQSTPQANPFCNFSHFAGTPAMSAVMSLARNHGLVRVTRDQCPPPQACTARWGGSRASSLCRSTSVTSSPPESLTSEPPPLVHSRGSRSSSVSSSASCVSAASLPSRFDRCALQRATTQPREGCLPVDPVLSRVRTTNDTLCQRTLSDLDTCTNSPESWERQSTGADSNIVESVTVWSKVPSIQTMKTLCPQDWEAAEVLCELPSQVTTPNSWQITPKKKFPAMLTRSKTSDESDAQVTPRASCGNVPSLDNVPSPTCHKRSYSTTADSLQDQVRNQLRSSLWSRDIPDRTINAPTRNIPGQSPTQTFREKKLPIPTKGSEGRKRHCAYQATAADRASEMLRADLMRGRPIR